jgi:hypothetical protein
MKSSKAILLAIAMVIGLGTVAVAHDEHQDNNRRWGRDRNADAIEYGYHNGYRDGFRHGQNDRSRRAGYDRRDNNYRRADNGYQSYMGPRGQYRKGYRDGYGEGYDDAYYGRRARSSGTYGRNGEWSVWDRDRDGDIDRNDRWGRANGNAEKFGYEDGRQAGQRDRQGRHSYRPTVWEAYKDADHGMSSSSGYRSSDDYKREYRRAFIEGYDQAYGRR